MSKILLLELRRNDPRTESVDLVQINISELEGLILGEAIACNTVIRSLDLWGSSHRGVREIIKKIRNHKTLSHLSLNQAVNYYLKFIGKEPPCFSHIQTLKLGMNSDNNINFIPKLQNLNHLVLTEISSKSLTQALMILTTMPQVTRLGLKKVSVQTTAVPILIQIAQRLDLLCFHGVGGLTGAMIHNMIVKNQNLISFRYRRDEKNYITDDIGKVFDALKINTTLESFTIGCSSLDIGYVGQIITHNNTLFQITIDATEMKVDESCLVKAMIGNGQLVSLILNIDDHQYQFNYKMRRLLRRNCENHNMRRVTLVKLLIEHMEYQSSSDDQYLSNYNYYKSQTARNL